MIQKGLEVGEWGEAVVEGQGGTLVEVDGAEEGEGLLEVGVMDGGESGRGEEVDGGAGDGVDGDPAVVGEEDELDGVGGDGFEEDVERDGSGVVVVEDHEGRVEAFLVMERRCESGRLEYWWSCPA